MLSEKERKVIIRYCQCPKIAIVSVIMALGLGGPWLILEMIDDLVFENKGSLGIGFYIYIVFVILFMILFCYCMLAPKFGMRSKKWKELQRRVYLQQHENNYSDRVSKNMVERSAGNLMSKGDNKTVQNLGHAAQFNAAVDSIDIATDQAFDMMANAYEMADAYGLKVLSIKKQLVAMVILPICLLVVSYIPQYMSANNVKKQNMELATESIHKFEDALKDCGYVSADDPSQRYNEQYSVTGYIHELNGQDNSYVDITVNETGTVIKTTYHYDVDINLSLEENLKNVQNDFETLHSYIQNVDVSTQSSDLLTKYELSDEFKTQFLNGTYYDEIDVSEDGNQSRIYTCFSTDSKEDFNEYSNPYIYIYIKGTN